MPYPVSLEGLPATNPSQAVIQCNDCKTETDVDKFCKTCRKSLCGRCTESHIRDQSIHDIVSRTGKAIRESEVSTILTPCSLHPEYIYSKYCNYCDKPCCIKCIDDEHKYHSTTAIQSKYIACEDKLNDLTMEIQKNYLPVLASNIERLKIAQQLQEKGCQEVTREVNRIRGEMKAVVDDRCDELLAELNKKEAEQLSSITDVISDLEKQIKESEIFISECCAKVREGGLGLIKFSKNTPQTTDILPSKKTYIIPSFAPSQNMLDYITSLVGELKWEDREMDLIKTPKAIMQDLEYVKPGIDIKLLGSFRTIVDATSVVPTGKDTAWVADSDRHAMTMYDVTGRKITSVIVTKGVGIWDLTVKNSGDVIVCNDDKNVRLLTANGVVTDLINTKPYSPRGVCLNEREEIMVCMSGMVDGNHVAVYSPDGKNKRARTITVKEGKGKQLLTDPRRVVMNGEYISVMNFDSNVVTCDEEGKIRWVYGGSYLGNLGAVGICVDKFRNLLISDYNNHCVHYVDREGVLIQVLLNQEHGIEFPMGIGVDDESGTVWVGCERRSDREALIFRYLET